MPWRISATGSAAKVKRIVEGTTCNCEDALQLTAVKGLLAAEVDRIEESCPGSVIKVEASGNYAFGRPPVDAAGGGQFDPNASRLSVTVERVQLLL